MNRTTLALCAAIFLGLVFAVGLTSACQMQTEYRDMQAVAIKELHLTTVISPTQVVWEMLGQVNRARALNDLRRLTGEDPVYQPADQ